MTAARRKIAILVGDGMGDFPLPELGGKTLLQAARIPCIRRLAAAGEARLVQTVPDGMYPGSDVANLSLLGYNPREHYRGRAPIEAAGAGLPLQADDVAFRCNLVTVADGRMDDYSAGHIPSDQAAELIEALNAALRTDSLRFHAGVSYRHLLIWRNGPDELETEPPHDFAGEAVAPHLPRGPRAEEVRALMERSRAILAGHPVNRRRQAAGQKPATQIWLWGQGRAMRLESFPQRYGLRGGAVSAVDLVRGLAVLAGLRPIRVPGATGFLDTNYAGKVSAALEVLAQDDFVFVHVEAPDECGHLGDLPKKLQAIEAFDQRIVGPVWQGLEQRGQPFRLVVCTDHRTPVTLRGHSPEPVPAVKLDGPVGAVSAEAPFDEFIGGGRSSGMMYAWVRALLTA